MKLPQLQQRLLLNCFIYHQFGLEKPDEMMKHLAKVHEGYMAGGQSYFCQAIKTLAFVNSHFQTQLDEYDRRIKGYVQQLNRHRPPIQLRYFQYLAALFAELYLDRLFNQGDKLLAGINAYAHKLNKTLSPKVYKYPSLDKSDLNKLAFWMATGSGKTLLLHINYWQYLYYSGSSKPDNILLITPYESLSAQHAVELYDSGIPHRRYDEPVSLVLGEQERNAMQLLEITKLTGKKRGGGSRIETSELGRNNLLFVDEGHRGAKGDVWRQLRSDVAQDGFTFEYSATFGQIVNGAGLGKRPGLLDEYGKAILFDYSYPHFHSDGYGKDYWIINLKTETGDFKEWIMLGNLLAFYEQSSAFQDQARAFRPYNLEAPLWVFVGHRVTSGRTKKDKITLTDIQEVVAFFDDFLSHRPQWIDRLDRILTGKTELKQDGIDLFEYMFAYLKSKGITADSLYDDIVRRIFHGEPGESLRVVQMKNIEKEIGLSVGSGNPYFGVIRIGNVSELVKLFAASDLPVSQEMLAHSLFDTINDHESTINVLIGSRMFMEGWDCYRVSSMGLINIGRGEGSQIIQLFGRGVRLRGKNRTLKRSEILEPDTRPAHIELLETLKVFGIRADYMAQFRNLLRREGVETDYEEVNVPLKINADFLAQDLRVPRLPEGERFQEKKSVVLGVDKHIEVTTNLLPQVESVTGASETIGQVQGENQAHKLRQLLPLLNWQGIYFDLLVYRREKGYTNLTFSLDTLRAIMREINIHLICLDNHLKPYNMTGSNPIQDIVLTVLRKYIKSYYNHRRQDWEQKRIELFTLEETDANLAWPGYKVRVDPSLAHIVRDLIDQVDKLHTLDESKYPHIHFDRHLYQPLLVKLKKDKRTEAINPQGLNEGEMLFVKHLRQFLTDKKNESQYQNRKFFLLRNLSVGKGISFFDEKKGTTFYPDFILWILEGNTQRIVFIDPHGIRNEGWDSPKLKLFQKLRKWEPDLNAKTSEWNVYLTSFVVSPTSYADLAKSWVHDHNEGEFPKERQVFFQDANGKYVSEIIAKTLAI